MTRDSLNKERMLMEHTEKLADTEFYRKFKMFFTGLIFAIISFIGSNAVKVDSKCIKAMEITALSMLLISGILLLVSLSGTRVRYPYTELINRKGYKKYRHSTLYFIFNLQCHYWSLFILGMVLLLIDRGFMLFQ